jgi:hypothetical protein
MRGDIGTNYFNLMKNIIDNTNETDYIKGEPIRTIYGRGYVEDITFCEGVKHINIKFRFGRGSLK